MGLDRQLALQRRHRSLMAIRPLANPAGNPDGLERAVAGEVQTIRIDQRACVFDLASQCNRVAPHRGAEMAAGFRHVPRQRNITHPVRRFRQLAQEPARRLERAVHVLQRTGPAEPGKLQPRGRMAFGDRSRLIDPDKEERDALGSGALQR